MPTRRHYAKPRHVEHRSTCFERFGYVGVIADLFARKVVGWHIADHMRAELVTAAFDLAVGRRRVKPGLIFHGDRGSQYVSRTLRARIDRARMRQSMSARGNCYDNAVVASSNDKLKQELIHRHVWSNKAAAKAAIANSNADTPRASRPN